MPARGLPWTVLGAFLFVLAFEVTLHFIPDGVLLRYGKGLGTYYEVRHSIAAWGGAEVSVLGNSRGRENLVLPQLRTRLQEALGRDLSVANYSCPDAKIDEMELICEELLTAKSRPSLILAFVSPRVFLGRDWNVFRREVFGVFPDEFGQAQEHLLAAWSEKPLWEFRNFLGDHFLTFRHRYYVRNSLVSLMRGRRAMSAVQGEKTMWQQYSAHRNLRDNPISADRIKRFVADQFKAEGAEMMNPERVAALERMIARCRESGVALVLVSSPISEPLLKAYPAGYYSGFEEVMAEISHRTNVTWLSREDLGIQFDLEDFREQSHLNLHGSTRFTDYLADQVVIPELRGAVDR